MGIRSVALAINKMDLVDWSDRVYRDIAGRLSRFASAIGNRRHNSDPDLCARLVSNIATRGTASRLVSEVQL